MENNGDFAGGKKENDEIVETNNITIRATRFRVIT